MHDITYWDEASMRARAVPEGRPVRCGELKKGMGSAPALGTRKGRYENLPFLVPRAEAILSLITSGYRVFFDYMELVYCQ